MCGQGPSNGSGQAMALGAGLGVAGIVPEADVAGLAAFLRLFARVMANGAAGLVAGWVHALEEECAVSPLWEVFVQLMCHPVPQARPAFPAFLHMAPGPARLQTRAYAHANQYPGEFFRCLTPVRLAEAQGRAGQRHCGIRAAARDSGGAVGAPAGGGGSVARPDWRQRRGRRAAL